MDLQVIKRMHAGSVRPRMAAIALGAALLAHVGDAAAQARCVPPAAGMVGWWPFDETSGTMAADRAGSPQNGAHAGQPTVVEGRVRRALDFNHRTSYVEAASAKELQFGTGDFSFDAWVWLRDVSGLSSLIDKRELGFDVRGYHVFVEYGDLGLQLADGGYDNFHSGIQLPTMEWTHVAITVDRDDPEGIRWYLNGVAMGNNGNPLLHPGSLDTAAPLRIGGHSQAAYNNLDGKMDEVALYDRALTPTQVAKIYAAGSAGRCRLKAGTRSSPIHTPGFPRARAAGGAR
jgi:hypothetical protein